MFEMVLVEEGMSPGGGVICMYILLESVSEWKGVDEAFRCDTHEECDKGRL